MNDVFAERPEAREGVGEYEAGDAVGMRDGPQAGLAAMDRIEGNLGGYALAHAARADLLRRLGKHDAARDSYQRALALTRQPAELRFLVSRLASLR